MTNHLLRRSVWREARPLFKGARSELRYFLLKMVDLSETDVIRRYIISGARRFSNYWWGSSILLGGVGFLLAGISSYLGKDLFPPIQSKSILFFPQGLVMCFYGILGVLFSLYVWFTLLWSIGSGFNEFNREAGLVRIFRWGFPGKNRRIDICYPITDIEGIKVEWKEGLSPRRTIYMRLKGNREIPLSRVGEPTTLDQIERQAAELAKFLQVSLEMPS